VSAKRSGLAERPVLLWVDLTGSEHDSMLACDVEDHCSIHRLRDSQRIAAMVDLVAPNVLCFDYDYPTEAGLAALTRTKRDFPRIPILMLTVYHSEALALWALRARVWDYIVKPFSMDNLLHSAVSLFRVCREQDRDSGSRRIILPLHDFNDWRKMTVSEKTILRAQTYVYEHMSENICLRDVANFCCVSHTHLSRAFKHVGGTTFTQFMLQTRIKRATELLADPVLSVTNVCYEVGFRDCSHFGRVFRRFVGLSPSQYRKMLPENEHSTTQTVRFLPA
jgi:YesN/AraC family two-component response regulator